MATAETAKATLIHVGVRASDVQASLRFWRDGLGLRVANELERGLDLTDGYHNVRVFQHRGAPRAPHVRGIVDYLHVGVVVENLAETAQRLNAMGFRIYWDGVSGGQATDGFDPAHPPSESFKVEDPDGITVDVTGSRGQWPGVGL